MSLQTALSGLLSAQTGLNTTSNDLANASTTAYKSQTALFEDVYPANATNTPGIGTATEGISTDLTQGNLTSTGNSLDAAIQGNGYFVVSNKGSNQYTRDGAFQLSTSGQLETLNGASVLGYSSTNGVLGSTLGAITINTGAVPANASKNLGVTLNLNSGDTQIPSTTAFNASDPSTYSESTSVVTYDSLGNANRVQLYLVQNQPATTGATPNWTVYAQPQLANGTTVGSPQTLTTLGFSSTGALTSGNPATLNVNWGNGAAASNVAFNFSGTTLAAQNFAVAGVTNDGYAPGSYTGSSISSDGSIEATYSNGQTVSAGKIALANFINPEGLTPVTGNLYSISNTSGQAVVNTPGNGLAGTLSGGSLESSNASTSSLLVSLIQYQQAYQANTSVIQTEQQDSQRLVQI
ncbi:flagellar hook protein FlgE [Acidocella aminolytica]|jgi:flagellar hook protein FlgE|uniref:Flagellar hook protein FlgE n=1 Tax=Acidocella aminolytica 101 = DSM 11237 TaxID=1120923 RepID=A0A0D6PFP6_9PROT|nr:flagellar hook protein FlgE [Acidocella aminolytica]GAN80038.1 flagellar hook protein FlgE [Acidocella aminolytica 101 = DSM 11237]GBQ40607.1 flagellar hook protein FlgE [Acidocella aminolytica 101 = DSM 11237]SHF08065.1 flagellar hook protein FlgE [Acidocella aminolytica 101 = DSM 11237]